jgi:hypothetical protein
MRNISVYYIWARFITEEGNGMPKLIIEKCNLLYTLVNTNEAVSYTRAGHHSPVIDDAVSMIMKDPFYP